MLSTLWIGSASWLCQVISDCFVKTLPCKTSLWWGLLNFWVWLSEGSGRNAVCTPWTWAHLEESTGVRAWPQHPLKQARHIGPGLWTPALRADTTSEHQVWSWLAALCAEVGTSALGQSTGPVHTSLCCWGRLPRASLQPPSDHPSLQDIKGNVDLEINTFVEMVSYHRLVT